MMSIWKDIKLSQIGPPNVQKCVDYKKTYDELPKYQEFFLEEWNIIE